MMEEDKKDDKQEVENANDDEKVGAGGASEPSGKGKQEKKGEKPDLKSLEKEVNSEKMAEAERQRELVNMAKALNYVQQVEAEIEAYNDDIKAMAKKLLSDDKLDVASKAEQLRTLSLANFFKGVDLAGLTASQQKIAKQALEYNGNEKAELLKQFIVEQEQANAEAEKLKKANIMAGNVLNEKDLAKMNVYEKSRYEAEQLNLASIRRQQAFHQKFYEKRGY